MRTWAATRVEPNEAEPINQLLSELASLLIETVVAAEEAGDRSVNPWLDLWRAQNMVWTFLRSGPGRSPRDDERDAIRRLAERLGFDAGVVAARRAA